MCSNTIVEDDEEMTNIFVPPTTTAEAGVNDGNGNVVVLHTGCCILELCYIVSSDRNIIYLYGQQRHITESSSSHSLSLPFRNNVLAMQRTD